MSKILDKVRDLDPYDIDAAKGALSVFFPNLSKHEEGDCIRWLKALENVINRFPKLCGSQRTTIEKYITHFIDCSNYNTVVEVAKCAHALQQVRPGQEKAATAKVCWRDQMSALCNAVHSLISEIFPNAANIYRNAEEQEAQSSNSQIIAALINIREVSGHNIANRDSILTTRLRNVFVFIQAMLVEIYPVAKPVMPQLILDVVIRTLGASAGAHNQTDVSVVKQQALRTLDALMACLGSNLIPFSPLVLKCVMQTLRWSSDNASEETNKVRIAAYNSLSYWLSILRTHRAGTGRARAWQDELVQHVSSDVTPVHTVHTINIDNQMRNLSKKQKKKQARIQLQQSSIATYSPNDINKKPMSTESNDEIAIAALDCTETFLTVCGVFLKPATHKVFHELLVRQCFLLEDYSSERALALLRVLETSRKSAPPGVPPPTQYCLQLYSAHLNSQHREISKFCSQALLDIRLHLHCSPASLNFAAEVRSEKRVEEKKKVSRRNREALESLLGVDKVPPELADVEEIPENDEPINKKARLVDIADKISLNSSSEDSIQICESDSDTGEVEEVALTQEVNADIHEVNADIHEVNADIHEVNADIHEVNADLNEVTTEIEDNNASRTIHELTTQIPLHVSNDTIDGAESPKSIEVVYGNPNAESERVSVIEKLDDENLPSTNETDDVQITCGQMMKSLEDEAKIENGLCEEVKVNESEPKVNGVKSPEREQDDVVEGSVTVKIAANNEDMSVEAMLADFVDEVKDDNLTQA